MPNRIEPQLQSVGASEPAEIRGSVFTTAAESSLSIQSNTSDGSANSQATMPVQDVKHDPPYRAHILYDQGKRLATMPRSKVGDFTQTAFWTALATAPSGVSGLVDLLAKNPTGPKIIDITDFGIFIISIAFTILGGFYMREDQTSLQYLDEIFKIPKQNTRGFRFLRSKTPL